MAATEPREGLKARARLDHRMLAAAVIGGALLAWLLLAWMHARGLGHHAAFAVPDDVDQPAAPVGVSPGVPLSAAPDPGVAATSEHVHGAGVGESSGRPGGFAWFADTDSAAIVLALSAWVLMVVAMMLPTALPMLALVRSLLARRRHRRMVLVLGVASFVAVWLAVGAALIVNSAVLQALSEQWRWLGEHGQLGAGAVLVVAGAYQFSPLKNACLRACRTPRSFAFVYWRGVRPAWVEVMTMTAAYAASCVGCCWALMTVCLIVGTAASLPAMITFTAVMAAERLVSWGRRLMRPVGAGLMLAGLAVGLAWLPII